MFFIPDAFSKLTLDSLSTTYFVLSLCIPFVMPFLKMTNISVFQLHITI